MRACLLLVCFVIPFVIAKVNYQGAETEDNDFAEFEDFDDGMHTLATQSLFAVKFVHI